MPRRVGGRIDGALSRAERGVIPACEQLGMGFVAFSPLASGFRSSTATATARDTGDAIGRVITRFDATTSRRRPISS